MSWNPDAVPSEAFPIAHDLGVELAKQARALESSAAEVKSRAEAMAMADKSYKVAWHKAYARSQATSHAAREAESDAKTLDERHVLKMAEALLESARQANRSTIASASLAQTWAATVRQEMEFAGRSGGK